MSVHSLYGGGESLKERLSNAVNHSQKLQNLNGDLGQVKADIEKMSDKINRLSGMIEQKTDRDDLIDLKASLNQINDRVSGIEQHLDICVSKECLKAELDAISQCMEDFILNGGGNTPRVNIDAFEKRISDIENKLYSQPTINIRTASDIDKNTENTLKSDASLFRLPQKKPKA